jgi:hypothetical protein
MERFPIRGLSVLEAAPANWRGLVRLERNSMKPIYTNNIKITGGLVLGIPIRYALVCVAFLLIGIFTGLMGGLLVLAIGMIPACLAYGYSLKVKGNPEGYTSNLLRSLTASKYINPRAIQNVWEEQD